MIAPQNPKNEVDRLNELRSLNVLDTSKNVRIDNLVYLASTIADCPISLVSLVDKDRQWFKSKVGISELETPRDISFCGHAINSDEEFLVVEDALKDERFHDNPLVNTESGIRFYAGKKLTTSSGFNIGTLCVIDKKPRQLSKVQEKQLEIISNEIMSIIEDESQLEKGKEKLQKRSAFISSLSHEIRTPLTSVLGYLDVLESELKMSSLDKNKLKKTTETIKDSAGHLSHLIGDVLDLSKLESHKRKESKEVFSVKTFFTKLSNILSIQTKENNVTFNIKLSEQLPLFINEDPLLIKQMLINVCSNAIKFSAGGLVELFVNYTEEEKKLTMDIIDNGIGMSQSESKKIFSPYEQGNKKIAKKFQGTGLGLAISKEIANLLSGSLDLVKTTKGEGSHFRVSFPIEPSFESLASDNSELILNSSKIRKNFKKILIIDDAKENRFLLKHYLREFNMEFEEASNAAEALDKFESRFDAIFLDIQLPDMSGFDLYKKMKTRIKNNQRVIAFTASIEDTEKKKCFDLGFDSFLPKPFSTESIFKSLLDREGAVSRVRH